MIVDDPENDRIREIVPFQESVYSYQEYDDRNGDHDRERDDDPMIGPEIGHATDRTDHVIDENQLIESVVDHVIDTNRDITPLLQNHPPVHLREQRQ